jgi:hypothetical protein
VPIHRPPSTFQIIASAATSSTVMMMRRTNRFIVGSGQAGSNAESLKADFLHHLNGRKHWRVCLAASGYRRARLQPLDSGRDDPLSPDCVGSSSIGEFCLPVLNSKILRNIPGIIAEIGLTRMLGAAGVPTTS